MKPLSMEVCSTCTPACIVLATSTYPQALAQIYYEKALNIHGSPEILGLVNSAPYLCCAFACWLNYPLNRLLDRRGVIFLTCLISSITCLGQAFPQTWQQLFVARFLLGFGIGPKRWVFTFNCSLSSMLRLWQCHYTDLCCRMCAR